MSRKLSNRRSKHVIKTVVVSQPSSVEDGSEKSQFFNGRIQLFIWLGGVVLVALGYLTMKMFAMNAYPGDEYIYLFQAKLISQGVVPYSEFSMAHPPLQMLFTAFVMKIFGFSFIGSRFLPILWCVAGGIGLATLVYKEYGAIVSITAMALYLFAHEPLRASTHYTGVNMTVALLIFAVLAYRCKAIPLTAMFSVFAVFTRLYAAPGVVIIVAHALVSNRRNGLKLIIWGAGLGLLAGVAVGLWTGFGEMIHNMLLYHAQKTPMGEVRLAVMRDKVLFHNATIALLFVVGQFWLLADIGRAYRDTAEGGPMVRLRQAIMQSNTSLALLANGIALAYLIVLLSMDRIWMYYFIPAFPFAGVIAGCLVERWIGALGRLIHTLRNPKSVKPSWGQDGLNLVLLALFVIGFALSPTLESRLSYYKKEIDLPVAKRTHRYKWNPGMLPEPVSDLIKAMLWEEERIIGNTYYWWNFVLWHESLVFEIAHDIVEMIEKETSSEGEIFGDSGTVPMFALLANRQIAANEVDTNIQRYRSGNADPKELIARIDNEKTELIILRNRFGVYGVTELRELVKKKYRAIKSFRSAQGKVYYLFKRIAE
jgi:hypothetical protein